MFSKKLFLFILNLFLALSVFPSYGSNFLSAYVTFEISDNWICKSFGVDWVCRHTLKKGDKQAIMLVTAYEGKATEDLDAYLRLFNHWRFSHRMLHVQKISVYRHDWVEAFYKDRFPGLFNRYVATICCKNEVSKIHVFVGFYAHDENYTYYSNQFLRSVRTLKLVKDIREALKKIRSQTKGQREEMMSYIEKMIMGADMEDDFPLNAGKGFDFDLFHLVTLLLVIFFVSGVFYFYYRRKKRRRRRRKRRRKVKRRSTGQK